MARAGRFSGLHSRHVTTAYAHLMLARAEEAGARDKKAAMSAAGEACRLALKHGKGDRGGLLPAYRLQGTYEWLRGHRGAAEKWWQKSLDLADELDARYERALTRPGDGPAAGRPRTNSNWPRPSSRRWARSTTWPRPAGCWGEPWMSRRTLSSWSRSEVTSVAHQVFLSYATEDADSARLLCRVLEAEEGIRCWIAPRDVPAGTDYAAAILEGIRNAELVLLLFSASTNASPYVLREIERAVAYERPVISVRLDGATPNPSLEYYLNMLQWLDAPRGIESKRREIVAAVRKQLEGGVTGIASLASAASARTASTFPAAPAPPPTPTDARSPEGERKLVTVLVAGVSDFAGLSRRLDPEALHDLVTECFERLVPAIERYGGTVDKVTDESFIGLFGAPKAHEDDPERALHAAIEMRQALTFFNKGRSLPVPVHFGVNTGMVFAGGVGTAERQDYSVMGEAVSAASGLKDRATARRDPGGTRHASSRRASLHLGASRKGPGEERDPADRCLSAP